MNDLIVGFDASDIDFKQELINQFGEDSIDFVERKGFDGNEFIFIALIPIVSITIEVVDFVLNHIINKKEKGRVIIRNNREIRIENYTAEEVKELLEVILNNDEEA